MNIRKTKKANDWVRRGDTKGIKYKQKETNGDKKGAVPVGLTRRGSYEESFVLGEGKEKKG